MTSLSLSIIIIVVGIIGSITAEYCDNKWYDDLLGIVSYTLIGMGFIIMGFIGLL